MNVYGLSASAGSVRRIKFRDELRIIPKWLVWTCISLYILALIAGVGINLGNLHFGEPIFPGDGSLRGHPALSCFALAGAITVGAFVFSLFLFILGYVYRDAKRRGMNPALWTLLVLILSAGYVFIGLIIYLAGARAAAIRLPAMRGHRFSALQFLPQLQIQPASRLPALPARSW